MARRYKVDQLMIDVVDAGAVDRLEDFCPVPSIINCPGFSIIGCGAISGIGCGGISACVGRSVCPAASLICGISIIGGASCAEACASCAGCSLEASCGLTRVSHPAVCSIGHLEGLGVLRRQLEQVLSDLDTRVQEIETRAQPQNASEAEELESRLGAALEQVRRWRAEMGEDSPGSPA